MYYQQEKVGEVTWSQVGNHNIQNALMAIAAAHHVGVPVKEACLALNSFINARRRLELRGVEMVSVFTMTSHIIQLLFWRR